MDKTLTKVRLIWLDSLKGFVIFSVVFGHVLLGYVENNAFPNVNAELNILKNWIYTWHMPVFLMISGFSFSILINESEENQRKNKLLSHILNFTMIYWIFSIFLGVLKILFTSFVDNPLNWNDLLTMIIFPNWIMWYLWVLIFFYISFYILLKKINIYMIFIFTIFISIIGKFISNYIEMRLCILYLFYGLMFFCMGILLRQKKAGCSKICSVISIAYTMTYAILYFAFNSMSSLPIWGQTLAQVFNATAVSMLLFNIFMHTSAFNTGEGVFAKLGKSSLVIFLVHTYIVTMFKVLFIRMGSDKWIIAIVFTTIISISLSYLIYSYISKLPLIKYIFCPISIFERDK